MSAQGTMLGLANAGVSAIGGIAQGFKKSIEGADEMMAKKARQTVKQKISTKQNNNKAVQARLTKVKPGGLK